MKVDGITKGALSLPYIVVIQIERKIKFLCACDNKKTAEKLAKSVGGFVVSNKEVSR